MRRTALAAVIMVAVLAGACGGDDDGGEETGPGSSTTAPGTEETADDGADGGTPGDAPTDSADPADGSADADGSGGATTGPGGGDGGTASQGPPPNMSSQEICDRLPATAVASAVGIESATAEAGVAPTPQCSYLFAGANDTQSEITVAVLRAEEDLAGRTGAEAFDYVVDSNRAFAQGVELTETDMAVGDQAILLSGGNLHMGIIQLGSRIVTTIVRADSVDAPAAIRLSEATATFAP